MNDKRFKELLNAHLDACLNEAEAKELHAALAACEKRRREFRAHQRVQAGCVALFNQTARRAPCAPRLARALREADERLQRPRSESRVWPTWGLAGAMAACVALMVVRVSGPGLAVAEANLTPSDAPKTALQTATPSSRVNINTQPTLYREGMPSGLGFAAMGIPADVENAAATAATKWTLSEAEIPPYALEEIAAMNRAVQLSRRAASSGLGFSSSAAPSFHRSESAVWHGVSAQGLPVETASFRFER